MPPRPDDPFVKSFQAHQRAKLAAEYLALGWMRLILISPDGKGPYDDAHKAIRGTSSWALFRQRWRPGDRPWLTQPERTVTRAQAEMSGVLTLDEIRRALDLYPDAWFAVITGAYEDDKTALAIADIDLIDEFPGEAFGALQGTLAVWTGGGDGRRHFYADAPPDTPSRRFAWGELRAQGSYAVLPPFMDGRTWANPLSTPRRWLPPSLFMVAPLAQEAEADQAVEQDREDPANQGDARGLGSGGVSPGFARESPRFGPTSPRFASRSGAHSESDLARIRAELRVIVGEGKYSIEAGRVRVRCPLHASEMGGAATVLRGRHGDFIFHCSRCKVSVPMGALYGLVRGQRGLLIEVNKETGEVVEHWLPRLWKPSSLRWATRLLAETGRIELPVIGHVPVPLGAPSLRQVADGFLLLLRCRLYLRQDGDEIGVPFTKSFGSAWCDLHPSSFQRQKDNLIRLKWLEKAGKHQYVNDKGVAQGRKLTLWLPRGFDIEGGS